MKKGGGSKAALKKIESLLSQADITPNDRAVVSPALVREEATGHPASAIEMPDGTITTGKTTELLVSSASVLLNALKILAGLPDELHLISPEALEPITKLKSSYLDSRDARLHCNEVLIALSIASAKNEDARLALEQLDRVRGLEIDCYIGDGIMPRDYRKWEKLDNTANVFPVIADERTTNTYRIEVMMTEPVDPELLQQAVDLVLPRFPGFDLRMRSGIFWYYMEENGKPAPRVHEEDDYPCRLIPRNKNNNYMFRVTYYKKRINLEVFHVLADGMGGFTFLRELWYQYLRLLHPELREKQAYITKVIRTEEENFARTIDGGMRIFGEMLSDHKAKGETVFSGADAFKLYDTYGFPLDLTIEMVEEQGMTVDEDGFHKLMQEQRERAREARKALGDLGWDVMPSEANFVFARPPAPAKAADIFARLKEKGIFVRYFPGPLTGDRLRITIGTDAEMKTFLSALGRI